MRLAVADTGGSRLTGIKKCHEFRALAEPHSSWTPIEVASLTDRRVLVIADAPAASDVAYLPPVAPTVVFCADDNYDCQPHPRRAGLALQRPSVIRPLLTGARAEDVFITAVDPQAVCFEGTHAVLPRGCTRLSVGVSLAAVVGGSGTPRPVAYAAALDFTRHDVPATQPYLARSFPTHKLMATTIVTADELRRGAELDLALSVNGERRQRSSTARMILRPEELVEVIARRYPLRPGDVIFTGTPGGTAGDRKRGWLAPGDEVVAEVSGVGAVRTTIVAEG